MLIDRLGALLVQTMRVTIDGQDLPTGTMVSLEENKRIRGSGRVVVRVSEQYAGLIDPLLDGQTHQIEWYFGDILYAQMIAVFNPNEVERGNGLVSVHGMGNILKFL